ncbi:MAG: Rid family detoxifying hydrolase [Proteobacteria bacterium]|nr:Rid family detoxifying hydrolase [Pseudomonadota bacterium]MBU1713330.1 Rid family detoxifying hydrolase [Pseudomonadota bacterium]
MTLKAIQTDKAPAAIGPYSQGILAGQLLFVSGQIGIKPETGELAGPDFAAQANQALTNLSQIVITAGSDLSRVVSVDVFLTSMGNFSKLNTIYQEFFQGTKPARAVIEVSGLPKGACIEIKCIATL